MMICACCLRASEEATDDDPELDLLLDTLAEELGLPPDLQRVRDRGGPPRRPNVLHRPLGSSFFAAEEVTPRPVEGRRNGGQGGESRFESQVNITAAGGRYSGVRRTPSR